MWAMVGNQSTTCMGAVCLCGAELAGPIGERADADAAFVERVLLAAERIVLAVERRVTDIADVGVFAATRCRRCRW